MITRAALYDLGNRILGKVGLALVRKRKLFDEAGVTETYGLLPKDVLRIKGCVLGGLRRQLIEAKKTRWLEIGCGGTLEDGFYYVDIFPEGLVDRGFKGRYSRVDILHARAQDLKDLGMFDLIRMQHVFEHFSPEDGQVVLEHCASLLNPHGYLLISTPDLQIHARTYLSGLYKSNMRMEGFNKSARRRIAADAPNSFYFSMFAHSLLYEKHMWCYDVEGLKYMLTMTGRFEEIEELGLDHALAEFPFTHNRPEEDVCVLAKRR